MELKDYMLEAHTTAVNKGWWSKERSFGDIIALIHSELSEALEDHRDGWQLHEIYYKEEKPCGIPVEFADALIRIFDVCERYDVPLEEALQLKMEYNKNRGRKTI